MSKNNVTFVKKEYNTIVKDKIEICPNTIDPTDSKNESIDKDAVKQSFGLPTNKMLLLYGGNFGKPQNIDYVISVIRACGDLENVHFVLSGDGTEYCKIEELKKKGCKNLSIFDSMKYDDYKQLLTVCNVGLIFLDYRFTIPNMPSRMLDYINYGLPILAATDNNTDLTRIIKEQNIGWHVISNDVEKYHDTVLEISKKYIEDKEYLLDIGKNSRKLLLKNYTTETAYNIIMDSYNRVVGERSINV